MTRLISYMRGALVGLTLLGGACQGELMMRLGGGGGGPDMAAPTGGDMGPACPNGITFQDIAQVIAVQGCDNGLAACHSATTTKSTLHMPPSNNATDAAAVMAIYKALVPAEVNLAMPEKSTLLLKNLVADDKGGIVHTNGKIPDPNGQIYMLWLNWIRLGAKFECVPLSQLPDAGAGTGPTDAATPVDGGAG